MNTRRLLVSTSRYLLNVDILKKNISVVNDKYGLFYGITWDNENIYVAARWYPEYIPLISRFERPRLLVLDNNLKLLDVVKINNKADGLHQILYINKNLYLTCSKQDSILVGTVNDFSVWYPSTEQKDHNQDTHHFNSIWHHNGKIFLLGHNRGPSDVWVFPQDTQELINKTSIGNHAHNIWFEDGFLTVCDSRNGRIFSDEKGVLCETGEFPRGAIIAKDFNVIGLSGIAGRSNRIHTEGKLNIYSKNWKLLDQISLGRCGQVCEIRSLDGDDEAHNGLPSPVSL